MVKYMNDGLISGFSEMKSFFTLNNAFSAF
jgi:hypothetical protein